MRESLKKKVNVFVTSIQVKTRERRNKQKKEGKTHSQGTEWGKYAVVSVQQILTGNREII